MNQKVVTNQTGTSFQQILTRLGFDQEPSVLGTFDGFRAHFAFEDAANDFGVQHPNKDIGVYKCNSEKVILVNQELLSSEKKAILRNILKPTKRPFISVVKTSAAIKLPVEQEEPEKIPIYDGRN